MFTVGDAVTQKAFLAALCSAHGYAGRIEAWYGGALLDEVQFESGSVKVTARNRERRTLDLTVAEKLWPSLPSDPLSPFGVWLRGYATVYAGATVFPEVPVFAGPLSDVKRQRWSGKLTVSGRDPFRQVNREPFEALRTAPAGALIPEAILMLLQEVFPNATLLDLTGSTAVVPPSTVWDARAGSRGAAIDDLATAIGAEVFALPTAVPPDGHFVLRPIPMATDPVAWTLPTGAAAIVQSDELTKSSDRVVNRWIVTSERSDSTPIRVPVTDDDPASPTRYGGPMGKLTDFYSSPLIGSEAQAATAGLAKLTRSTGLARTRAIEVPTNPALEAGDVMWVSVEDETGQVHIADEFPVSLVHDPAAMKIDTRTTGSDA
jgi:hypothetical protein